MNKNHSWSFTRFAAIIFLCIFVISNVSILPGIHVTSDAQLLADANARILKIRRGTIALDFGSGNASMPITIIQRSHAFRFGCEAFQFDMFSNNTQNEIYQMQIDKDSNKTLNDEYRSLFSALFNHATLPFFWTTVEWTRGVYYYDSWLHNMTTWLASFNATPMGMPIIYQNPCCIAPWMASLNQTAQRQAALDHIDTVLSRFPEVKTWELVNEPTAASSQNTWLGSTPEATWETALARARQDRPGNTTQFLVNEYTIGDGVSPERYYQFVNNVVNDGYAPDAIGIQFHSTLAQFSMPTLASTLDKFGAFKIPCEITEFLPASNGSYTFGVHPGQITEETQATYAVEAYTMMFSLPSVYAISWWDFSGNKWPAWRGMYGAYMMAPDGRVLPVYAQLFNLIHRQWNSSTTTTLDASGKLQFTGFYGNYDYRIGTSGPFHHFSIVDSRPASERPWRISDIA